jgi:hypothetical protein
MPILSFGEYWQIKISGYNHVDCEPDFWGDRSDFETDEHLF